MVCGSRVAALLSTLANRSILAKAIAVAERFAAFVFALVRAIAVDAALGRAMVPATETVACIEANAPAANMAGIADFRIAGARVGIADRAGISTEILVDALVAIARQGLAGDCHAIACWWLHSRSGVVEPCR